MSDSHLIIAEARGAYCDTTPDGVSWQPLEASARLHNQTLRRLHGGLQGKKAAFIGIARRTYL